MSEIREDGTSFVGYEYKEIPSGGERASLCLDCYQSFGWVIDERTPEQALRGKGKILLKRNRKIINKMELTRLQRNFDSCVAELKALERAKRTQGMIAALTVGILGTALIAGSTFAAVSTPPNLWLMILLAVPGFLGWILPYFLYRAMVRRKTVQIEPLIEQTYDEINDICQKGSRLLP